MIYIAYYYFYCELSDKLDAAAPPPRTPVNCHMFLYIFYLVEC